MYLLMRRLTNNKHPWLRRFSPLLFTLLWSHDEQIKNCWKGGKEEWWLFGGKDKKTPIHIHPPCFVVRFILFHHIHKLSARKKSWFSDEEKKKISFEMSNKTKSRLHILILYSGVKVNSWIFFWHLEAGKNKPLMFPIFSYPSTHTHTHAQSLFSHSCFWQITH